MPQKTEEAVAPGSTLKPAQEPNYRDRLLTEKDAADILRLSSSFLAKARMNGNGPPYLKLGRSVRYQESALLKWMKCRQRLSTSEQAT
jgi:predicted DNA-binding transcriptional regulator AlpA